MYVRSSAREHEILRVPKKGCPLRLTDTRRKGTFICHFTAQFFTKTKEKADGATTHALLYSAWWAWNRWSAFLTRQDRAGLQKTSGPRACVADVTNPCKHGYRRTHNMWDRFAGHSTGSGCLQKPSSWRTHKKSDVRGRDPSIILRRCDFQRSDTS